MLQPTTQRSQEGPEEGCLKSHSDEEIKWTTEADGGRELGGSRGWEVTRRENRNRWEGIAGTRETTAVTISGD